VEQSSAEVTLRVRAADAGPPFVVRAMPGAKLIFEWERSVRLAAPDSIDHIKSSRLLGFERERERERVHASSSTHRTSSCCSIYLHPLNSELLLMPTGATSIPCPRLVATT
jgi:hypothetical protein